ncbi:MAG: chloride channel protein [Bacteroidetes bacterium]|nr:chloride channel protein [Bacteroidota bacterium]
MKFWQRNKSIPVSVSLVSPFKPGFFNKRRLLYISFLAFLLGGAISYIAHLLILLINLVTNISFYGVFSAIPASPAGNTLGLFVILIPAIGGLVVGVLALYGSKAIRGHGIPEAMEKILTNQSKIPPAITYLKPVATAISIGTGGPFGAEGPIIATGGALGSTLGQLLKITHNERKILLASGATAGMAAIFGTPIAAIFLAIELLLFEFSPRSIIPVAIACITGAAGKHIFFGAEPVFFMNVKIEAASTEALLFYGILGLIFGILSILVTKCVYFIEDLFEKLPLHWMWWPAIGGLFVGLIGYFAPQTLGVGYNNITNLLNEELTVKVLGSLFILKFLSWSISLGSGTAGGTLAPLLTIGGAAGALCGICINSYFPEAGVPVHVAALVGMSAMFAGASRALLTSIIFALETTNQANALLPLLAACAGAYIVSFFLMENTIMTEKIARRGIKTPDSFEPDPLENILISEVLQKEDDILISENNTIGELREWLSKLATIKNYYIVTDDSGKYKGIISSLDIMNYTNSNESGIEGLLRTNVSTVSENLTLRLAAEKMDSLNIDFLPVLDERNRKIAGLITNSQIIEAYSSRNADHKKNHPSISLKRRGMEIIIHGRNFFEKSTK